MGSPSTSSSRHTVISSTARFQSRTLPSRSKAIIPRGDALTRANRFCWFVPNTALSFPDPSAALLAVMAVPLLFVTPPACCKYSHHLVELRPDQPACQQSRQLFQFRLFERRNRFGVFCRRNGSCPESVFAEP